jgi:hypothetical protein
MDPFPARHDYLNQGHLPAELRIHPEKYTEGAQSLGYAFGVVQPIQTDRDFHVGGLFPNRCHPFHHRFRASGLREFSEIDTKETLI